MKAVRKLHHEPGSIYVTDAPEARAPKAGEVRVRIAAASVCGSDLSIVKYNDAARAFNLALPVTMGHEGAGVVESVGAGVSGFSVGDHVAFESHIACGSCFQCRSGNGHVCANLRLLGLHLDGLFAESCTVPAAALFRIPKSIPLEHAALLEPAGVALHAIQATEQRLLGKRILVTGAGPVGLFISELAQLGGAARVVISEPNPWRRAMAASRGAVVNEPGDHELGALAGGDGFDIAFEASGHPDGAKSALRSLRTGGTYVPVGFGNEPLTFDAGEILNRRATTLVGSFGRRLWSTWHALVALTEERRLELGAFITHRLPLSGFDQAVALLSGESCKVLVLPALD